MNDRIRIGEGCGVGSAIRIEASRLDVRWKARIGRAA
jgi:hypothetical protein